MRARGYDIVPTRVGLAAVQRLAFRSCDVVVDVGANVGQFAERTRDLGFDGTIISFEPGSAAFAVLDRKARQDRHWSVHNVALGAEPGDGTLQITGNSVSSSLLDIAELHIAGDPASRTVATEQVVVSTLDEQLADLEGARLYLKLDVQGFELPVLRGATQTLERAAFLQTEISFAELYAGQSDWLELCQFLRDRGFWVRYLEPGYEDSRRGAMLQADLLFSTENATL